MTVAGWVPGVRVGHWTDPVARTGCTVVILPEGTVASGEVRGGAPATREVALLDPRRLVHHVDAVLLTGGSAFGLAAADGVARWCEAEGRGFPTAAGPVPIVVGLGIFDLTIGDPTVRPGPAEGEAACRAAVDGPPVTGQVGAGAGATVGKWRGPDHVRDGGLGTGTVVDGDLVVAAVAAVNAYGDVVPAGLEPPVGTAGAWAEGLFGAAVAATNTTVGVVVTNARLDKLGCRIVAEGAHDGLGRAVHPPHTAVDGDAVVAAATGPVDAGADQVRAMAVSAFAAAVRAAVTP